MGTKLTTWQCPRCTYVAFTAGWLWLVRVGRSVESVRTHVSRHIYPASMPCSQVCGRMLARSLMPSCALLLMVTSCPTTVKYTFHSPTPTGFSMRWCCTAATDAVQHGHPRSRRAGSTRLICPRRRCGGSSAVVVGAVRGAGPPGSLTGSGHTRLPAASALTTRPRAHSPTPKVARHAHTHTHTHKHTAIADPVHRITPCSCTSCSTSNDATRTACWKCQTLRTEPTVRGACTNGACAMTGIVPCTAYSPMTAGRDRTTCVDVIYREPKGGDRRRCEGR